MSPTTDADTPAMTPRTAAGRKVHDLLHASQWPACDGVGACLLLDDILAIEAEASAEPAALRAALERTADLPEDAPPPGMKADWYAAGWGDRGDALCAALSATQDGTPAGLDEERLANALGEAGIEGDLEHLAAAIAAEYAALSTSDSRREDEG